MVDQARLARQPHSRANSPAGPSHRPEADLQPTPPNRRGVRRWPLFVIASPAMVAIWSGWASLGQMCGFGLVEPFPGIVRWHLDSSITLPIGVESYGAYAMSAWLSAATPRTARRFAMWSSLGALGLGMGGQVVYHLLAAAHRTRAPWPVVAAVACLPVITLGFGAALAHLLRADTTVPAIEQPTADEEKKAEEDVKPAVHTSPILPRRLDHSSPGHRCRAPPSAPRQADLARQP